MRIDPLITLRAGNWRLSLGRHFYRHKIESYSGRFLVCVPGFILSRGYI